MLAVLALIVALQDPPAQPDVAAPVEATAPAIPVDAAVAPEPDVAEPALVPPIPASSEPSLADALTCQTVAATLGAGFGERAASETGTDRDAQISDYLTHLAERARQDARQRARSGMTEAGLDAAMSEAGLRRTAAADDGDRAQAELTRCAELYRID